MQRSGEELLAGAALSFEQHGGVRRRRALQRGEHLAQRRILADQLRRAAPDRELLLHQEVLGHQAAALERAGDEQQQVIGIDGLRQEVHRPFLHRRDRVLDAAVGGHDDDGDVGVDLLGGTEHAEAVPLGQAQIGQHHRRLLMLQQPHGLGLVAGFEDDMILPLQRVPEHRAQRVLVLDDENLGGSADPAGRHAGAARLFLDVGDLLACRSRFRCSTRFSSASAFWRSSAICAR